MNYNSSSCGFPTNKFIHYVYFFKTLTICVLFPDNVTTEKIKKDILTSQEEKSN